MERTKKFHVDFTKNSVSPFFQVPSDLRVRFGVELFENGKFKLLKNILNETLNKPETLDVSFISGYIVNDRRCREKTNIGKYVTIHNWLETIVHDEEIGTNVIFATVRNIRFDEAYQYIKSVARGSNTPYMIFYNDSYLVYVSTDVLDIISHDQNLIHNLKNQYEEVYDKYYENKEY
ncbi:hypothetical protein MOF38_01065 [Bacillus haynesii]|uniref:hypothetical protein n=1 Tax=Bacillus haynesii TaxID=1925021 RepID=UPI0022831292|nr:hypothetical protein [Bacillus haynesii]MCY7753103.1 hypothetical protein [Bacillus haynesii]MCY7772166.1 hypothetical protein [Bacillus haynesii]MCY8011230.1 hypothetical protein [Bacillus haynesii]MCY8343633.1 hypothetical protein [Bacillus haynesii]MCY9398375.1 hypothetical protein [Bacillus haynesii]